MAYKYKKTNSVIEKMVIVESKVLLDLKKERMGQEASLCISEFANVRQRVCRVLDCDLSQIDDVILNMITSMDISMSTIRSKRSRYNKYIKTLEPSFSQKGKKITQL
jgi:hypothetical protein